jgi:NAD-dependent dihydropyrimidine dehydrogenase PreA subunit
MWQPEKCPALHKIPPMTVAQLIAVLQTLPGSTYVRDVDEALMCQICGAERVVRPTQEFDQE